MLKRELQCCSRACPAGAVLPALPSPAPPSLLQAAQEEEDEDLGGVPAPMALLWWAMQACVAASALAPLAQAADRGQLDGRALLALLALPLLWGTWIHECAQLLARTCPDWDLGHTWLQQVQVRGSMCTASWRHSSGPLQQGTWAC